jgi:hypothetical protein
MRATTHSDGKGTLPQRKEVTMNGALLLCVYVFRLSISVFICKHLGYLHSSLGRSEESLYTLLLAHCLAHGSHSRNIYCLSFPPTIYITLSISGPKLTITKVVLH